MDWRNAVDDLASDNVSGATALTERAAAILVEVATAEPEASFLSTLRSAGLAIVAAHPTMAPLRNLVNAVFWAASPESGPGDVSSPAQPEVLRQSATDSQREAVREAIRQFVSASRASAGAVAEAGAALLPADATVLTISHSDAVARAVIAASAAGKRPRVVCLESRPIFEGRTLAARLAVAGVPALLTIDAAAAALIERRDAWRVTHVIVGADSISPDGVVNKVGTLGLVRLARRRLPCFVLAAAEKLWPVALWPRGDRPHDPREVLPEPIAGVDVENSYFDRTPLELFSGIATERGVLGAAAIRTAIAAIAIHPWQHEVRHVVTCFLIRHTRRGDRVLILRRSGLVATYRGRWAGVSGTVDTTPDEQAYREIAEETGLVGDDVVLLRKGEPLVVEDASLGRHWVIHPYLFRVSDPNRVRIDWEHTTARWVAPEAVRRFATVPHLADALDRVYP